MGCEQFATKFEAQSSLAHFDLQTRIHSSIVTNPILIA